MQKATLNQAHQFLNLIAQSGINKSQLQALEESGRFSKLLKAFMESADPGVTYQVTVNYSMSLADMIAVGKYDLVNEGITQEHFPLPDRAKDESCLQAPVELHLVHFGLSLTTKQVLTKLDEQGFRPATLSELCAFGAVYPELQRSYPLVALGSLWQYPEGYINCPNLDGNDDERGLELRWYDPSDRWHDFYRFVVVSK